MIHIRMKRGVTVVSDEDSPLAESPWHVSANGYAARNTRRSKEYLHRAVAQRAGLAVGGAQVDHVDGDRLNNTRPNLRVVGPAQNQHNRRNKRTGSSQFKGVSWSKSQRKWRATIVVAGKQVWLGDFIL